MVLGELVEKIKRYEVHGLGTTPTRDYLFNNFNNHLEKWLEKYGDCKVVDFREDEDVYGGLFILIFIDNRY